MPTSAATSNINASLDTGRVVLRQSEQIGLVSPEFSNIEAPSIRAAGVLPYVVFAAA